MISNLTITGFRAFRELRVDPLTRVNLFVGKNNAGKTSLLEALELVALGSATGLRRSLRRRGEEVLVDRDDRPSAIEPDPSHLFYGHSIVHGGSFSITDDERANWIRCQSTEMRVNYTVEESSEDEIIDEDFSSLGPALEIRSYRLIGPQFVRISPSGGLTRPIYPGNTALDNGPAVNFLGTETLSALEIGKLWDTLVLTPEEEGVAAALRIIEPQLERIALITESRRTSRAIFVKLTGSDSRIPLGSLGDGLKRLFNLTLHLFSAKGGYLLVDEIDTGLHHTVLMDMWKLVIETAKRLNVQVFATTHSLDCVHALAWVQEQNPDLAAEVTLHRVEKDAPATVVYSMDEIAIAERGQIEVR